MPITCFVATTPGVDAVRFGPKLDVALERALHGNLTTWCSLNFAPVPLESFWSISRFGVGENVLTWFGRYLGVDPYQTDRAGGYVGAGIFLVNAVAGGREIEANLSDMLEILRERCVQGDRLVRSLDAVAGSKAIVWPNSSPNLDASTTPASQPGGLGKDRPSTSFVDLSLGGITSIGDFLDLMQRGPALPEFGQIYFAPGPIRSLRGPAGTTGLAVSDLVSSGADAFSSTLKSSDHTATPSATPRRFGTRAAATPNFDQQRDLASEIDILRSQVSALAASRADGGRRDADLLDEIERVRRRVELFTVALLLIGVAIGLILFFSPVDAAGWRQAEQDSQALRQSIDAFARHQLQGPPTDKATTAATPVASAHVQNSGMVQSAGKTAADRAAARKLRLAQRVAAKKAALKKAAGSGNHDETPTKTGGATVTKTAPKAQIDSH